MPPRPTPYRLLDSLTQGDFQPGLTTVRVPTDRLATLALDLALNGPGDGTGSQVVSVTPVVRDSTPPRT